MFDKVKAIFEEQLGVSQDEMKLDTNFKDDLGAVSYTHLDVYKRQGYIGQNSIVKKEADRI